MLKYLFSSLNTQLSELHWIGIVILKGILEVGMQRELENINYTIQIVQKIKDTINSSGAMTIAKSAWFNLISQEDKGLWVNFTALLGSSIGYQHAHLCWYRYKELSISQLTSNVLWKKNKERGQQVFRVLRKSLQLGLIEMVCILVFCI